MPGRFETNSLTPIWMPLPSLTSYAKPEASQPIVYAPIAKNATYPRSSRPAKPTTMLSPSAITTYASAVTASSMNADPSCEEERQHRGAAKEDEGDHEIAVARYEAQVHPASLVCSPSSPWGLKTMISTR